MADLKKSGTYGSKSKIEREAHVHDVGFRWRHIETPDTKWIKGRNHELIYLTGAHPVNAEPPFSQLMEAGLHTPTNWHFIRNHGDVPQLEWEKHEIIIDGLVKKQKIIKMDELISMPKDWLIDIPITITCDGNRRKEVNLIKRTRGFNWGPGATSTARWKGVSLSHLILHYCEGISNEGKKISQEKGNPLYICFEGSDTLAKGEYGMSMPLEWAIDPTKDFMLAFEMNGERLTPDHGFPVRLILPGFVGGRMIKWMKKITISDKPSENHYHYFDNRLLPPNVDYDEGVMKGYFKSPDTILYEMNLNSVIYKPTYGEILTISDMQKTYELNGYAYSGGGRKITRVEITMDEGKTWVEAKIIYPEKSVRHGSKYWTWCHWSYEIDSWRFLHTQEIAVRAYDSSFNTQPENITWNALGVMNNTWYRVKIKVEEAKVPWITFHHPVQQGSLFGGWMMPSAQAIQEYKQLRVMPQSAEIAFAHGEFSKEISMEEVSQHNTKEDCWVIIDDAVYDLTGYLKEHPGGANSIMAFAGSNASRAFHDIHDQGAFESKEMFRMGAIATPPKMKGHPRDGETKLLHPQRWVPLIFTKKENVARDVRLFTFELEGENAGKQLGLPTGQHVLLSVQNTPLDFVVRPYTPIYPSHPKEDEGKLVFLIKIYKLGKMTQILDQLEIGSQIHVRGPSGPIMYLGDTKFMAHSRIVKATYLSMVAGGTGITPIYQMTKAILEGDSSPKFQIRIITANNSPADIPLRKELDDLEKEYSNRLKVWHTVSVVMPDEDKGWKYSVGHVDLRMMKDHLFTPKEDRDSLALVCGPPSMVAHCCFPSLEELGYTEDNLFEF